MTFTLQIPGHLTTEITVSQKDASGLTVKSQKTIQFGATRGDAAWVSVAP